MRPGNLLSFHLLRLRSRAGHELLALVGIAAGVALLFASQIAAGSLVSSASSLNAGIVGRAQLQLIARSPEGMSEAIIARVRATPGVVVAAPLLEADARAGGPDGHASVELVGAGPALKQLDGALVRRTHLDPFAGFGAVVLPAPLAQRLGVRRFGQILHLQIGGRSQEAALYAQLHAKQIGRLASSPLVIAPMRFAQELSGFGHVVTRILVQVAPGQRAVVSRRLAALGGSAADVRGANYETRLFSLAASASSESTTMFAAISALVGFLFAFNAVLLTVPQRRRLVQQLRREGFTPRAVAAVLGTDALVLGVLSCAAGLLLGDELSIHLLKAPPSYLSSAFAIGPQRVVSVQSIAVSVAGGMVAAALAVLLPLTGVFSSERFSRSVSSSPSTSRRHLAGPAGGRRRSGPLTGVTRPLAATRLVPLLGLLLLALTIVIAVAVPQLALLGMIAAVAALLLLLPLPLAAAADAVGALSERMVGIVAPLASIELRAQRSRAVAIAATGAVAVFGAVSIEGARGDLLRGLEAAAAETSGTNRLWAAPAGSYDRLMTAPFTPSAQGRLARLPGVASVSLYRGALLDIGDRRAWVIAPPLSVRPLLPAGQLLQGDAQRAEAQLRSGTGIVLSEAIAGEAHVSVGQTFTLPSPRPLSARVAAISTNVGWAPGAVMLSAAEYARGFGARSASAYAIGLAPGTSAKRVAHEVSAVLGRAFTVQSGAERQASLNAVSAAGLARLGQIALLVLLAAVLAMAAAIGAMVWQRRPLLAKLRLDGFSRGELWRAVLLQSVLLLLAGCASGALLALVGQQLLDHALQQIVGYPVIGSAALLAALASVGAVCAAAALVVCVPGWIAARVGPEVALQEC